MKIGFRKPNLKKRLKARTTGKLKRKVKKATNPFYGKKGVGYIKNPKKALYNKVYHKTTFGVGGIAKAGKRSSKSKANKEYMKPKTTTIVSIQDLVDKGRFDLLKQAKKDYFWKIVACYFYGAFLIIPLFFIPKNLKTYRGIKEALKNEDKSQ